MCCNMHAIILTTRYKIATPWHLGGIFDFAAYGCIDCDTRRKEKTKKNEKRAQWCIPRIRDTRECMFSLVTVTRDALARCIGRTLWRSYRCRYHASMHSIRREAPVRRVCACMILTRWRESVFWYLAREAHECTPYAA